jgi:polyferredoxin
MAMISINWNPSRRELRQFAGLCLVFFGGIAAWMYARHGAGPWPTTLAALAVGLGIPGLAFPVLLKPIYVGWMAAAFPIGWTVSHVLLGVIFYGIVTPIGLLLRLIGRDPMNRKFEPQAKSYWIEHEPAESARYFRMY